MDRSERRRRKGEGDEEEFDEEEQEEEEEEEGSIVVCVIWEKRVRTAVIRVYLCELVNFSKVEEEKVEVVSRTPICEHRCREGRRMLPCWS